MAYPVAATNKAVFRKPFIDFSNQDEVKVFGSSMMNVMTPTKDQIHTKKSTELRNMVTFLATLPLFLREK